jgi:hypothetical protein
MEAPRGSFCRECRVAILDEYYDVDGNVVCSACHAGRTLFRSRLLRGLKAFLLGSVAAAVGAGVYRMILFGSGWNLSIVAILVGYVVGGAVRTGSRDRGGRFYQFLAIFLTYSALVGMFLPDLWKAVSSTPQTEQVAENRIEKEILKEAKPEPEKRAVAEAAGESSAGAKAEATPAAASPKAVVRAEGKAKLAAPEAKGRAGDGETPPRARKTGGPLYLLGMLLFYLILMVGFVYSIPVFVGIHSPISGFIFGIGLWQAWRMNRASEVLVTGPYRIRG